MITGIGHDIADMDRIEAALVRPSARRFLERILTAGERKLAESYAGKRLTQFAAGRFAAKEAVVKAFGCGIGGKVGFGDIEILPGGSGKPECRLSPEAWRRLGLDPGLARIHVTITHDRSIASAFAVVERTGV